MSAATGVVINTMPAAMPAALPHARRTVAYSKYVHTTPMSACGNRIANELRPSKRTESAMSQMDAGGLSTVMALPASRLPHKKASQLLEPACAAAL